MRTVTVVIPAYNAASFICDALESLFTQTLLPDQVVVIDDGSTDNTFNIINEWKYLHEGFPLEIYHQENGGVSSARNAGIKHATSTYIAFLDSDDKVYPDHIKTLMQGVSNNENISISFADQEILGPDGILCASFLKDKRIMNVSYFQVENGLRILDSGLWESLIYGNYIPTSASLVRRKDVLKVGGFDTNLKTSEDRHLLLKISRLGKAAYFNKVIATKREHGNNLTNFKNKIIVAKNAYFAVKKLLDEIEKYNLDHNELNHTILALSIAEENWLYASRDIIYEYFQALLFLTKSGKYKYLIDYKNIFKAFVISLQRIFKRLPDYP